MCLHGGKKEKLVFLLKVEVSLKLVGADAECTVTVSPCPEKWCLAGCCAALFSGIPCFSAFLSASQPLQSQELPGYPDPSAAWAPCW